LWQLKPFVAAICSVGPQLLMQAPFVRQRAVREFGYYFQAFRITGLKLRQAHIGG
jgi:hypothetical protein